MRVFKTLQKAAILGVSFVCVITAPVQAQSKQDLQNRIEQLESEFQTLSRAIYKGSDRVGPLKTMADAQALVQKVEANMRNFQGQLEELSHRLDQLTQQHKNEKEATRLQFEDTNQAIQGLQKATTLLVEQLRLIRQSDRETALPKVSDLVGKPAAKAARSTSPALTNAPVSSASVKPVNAQPSLSQPGALAQYEAAFSLLKKGQYNSAQLHFENFLTNNPGHMLVSNAKYWLGETHYVRADFTQAARIFAEGFQAHPKGAKAPDNLLKLGLSLHALGKNDDACLALKQIGSVFPSGAGAVSARASQERKRIGCS